MATRLYPLLTATGPISSIGFGPSAPWSVYDFTHANIRYLSTVKGYSGPLTTFSVSENSDVYGYGVRTLALVSDRLSGAQTISGTLTTLFGALEDWTGDEMHSELYARVVNDDGTVTRGILYSGQDSEDIVTEWPTTATTQWYPSGASTGVTLSSVGATDGDRIIIELGYRAYNTSFSTLTGSTVAAGTWQTADASTTGTSASTVASWVEFSQNLTFQNTKTGTADIAVDPTATRSSGSGLSRTGTVDVTVDPTATRRVGTATYMPTPVAFDIDLEALPMKNGRSLNSQTPIDADINLTPDASAQTLLDGDSLTDINVTATLRAVLPAPTPPAAPVSPIYSGGTEPPASVGDVPTPKIRRISETYPTPVIVNGRPQ